MSAWPPMLADIGIPTLGLFWPVAWLLIVPVVLLEARLASAALGLSRKSSLVLAGVTNAVSTAVGVPVTWCALAFLELTLDGTAYGLDSFLGWIYASTIQSPWLIPYHSELRTLAPLALSFLALPLCAASIAVEYLVARLLYRGFPPLKLLRWAAKANLASYALLAVAAAALAGAGAEWHSRLVAPLTDPIAKWVFQLASRLARSG